MRTDVAYGTDGQAAGQSRGPAARFVRRRKSSYTSYDSLPYVRVL